MQVHNYFDYIHCFIGDLPHSLLVAIGIEAFNKFSQEQKEEEKEVDSQFPNSITSTYTNRTFKENIGHYGKKFLTGLGYVIKVTFSSARVRGKIDKSLFWIASFSFLFPHIDTIVHAIHCKTSLYFHCIQMTDEDQSGSSVIHVDIQSCSNADCTTSESNGSTQCSPLSTPNTPGNGSAHNGVTFVNQTQNVEDIEDDVFVKTVPTNPHLPRSIAARQEVI